ncbi:MAG: tRNA (adenosine(37)-N6)-threonylcarbamoyltransferase complex transferase subunit TsaD [candidate division FCPU426 bacterium]
MLVLGIETSCDETAAALVAAERGELKVRSSVVASQLAVHAPFGGVVPELASRQHLHHLPGVAAEALRQANASWQDVDAVAATHGPGLMGALLVGLAWAKAAAFGRGLPFIGVNHLEGHLLAAELNRSPLPDPCLGLVASGGHTSLFLIDRRQVPAYRLLARTRDDAVGEAFDKVAKLLGLAYPGGPSIERAARESAPAALPLFTLPRMKDGSADFSYSGLKTAVRVLLARRQETGEPVSAAAVADAFQRTVVEDLLQKTLATAERTGVRAVLLTGGVAANRPLREAFAAAAAERGLEFICPPREWCTDNAAMIAAAGSRRLAAGERSPWDLPAVPQLDLSPEGA